MGDASEWGDISFLLQKVNGASSWETSLSLTLTFVQEIFSLPFNNYEIMFTFGARSSGFCVCPSEVPTF